jgi:hypothetical protein
VVAVVVVVVAVVAVVVAVAVGEAPAKFGVPGALISVLFLANSGNIPLFYPQIGHNYLNL